MAMGPDAAQTFAASHDVPALFLIRLAGDSFEERRSAAFEAIDAPAPAATTTPS